MTTITRADLIPLLSALPLILLGNACAADSSASGLLNDNGADDEDEREDTDNGGSRDIFNPEEDTDDAGPMPDSESPDADATTPTDSDVTPPPDADAPDVDTDDATTPEDSASSEDSDTDDAPSVEDIKPDADATGDVPSEDATIEDADADADAADAVDVDTPDTPAADTVTGEDVGSDADTTVDPVETPIDVFFDLLPPTVFTDYCDDQVECDLTVLTADECVQAARDKADGFLAAHEAAYGTESAEYCAIALAIFLDCTYPLYECIGGDLEYLGYAGYECYEEVYIFQIYCYPDYFGL